MQIYGDSNSGNCLKVKWVCDKLALPYRWIEIDTRKGETRTPQFLKMNGAGQVPTIEFDDGRRLPESNAILCYLAEGSRYLPDDRWQRAQVLQWLFFEQYSHEPYIAVRKALLTFPERARDATPERLALTLERGNKALGVMNGHLAANAFFAGSSYSVADIALYAYTHTAGMGGFQLDAYPAVVEWLRRVEADEGHVPIEWEP